MLHQRPRGLCTPPCYRSASGQRRQDFEFLFLRVTEVVLLKRCSCVVIFDGPIFKGDLCCKSRRTLVAPIICILLEKPLLGAHFLPHSLIVLNFFVTSHV